MTLVSNRSPRILRIFARPDSTSLRMAGVMSYCLPVYSTFIEHPPGILDSMIWAQTTGVASVAAARLRSAAEAVLVSDFDGAPEATPGYKPTFSLCAGGYSGCACPPDILQPCGE